MDTNNNKPLKLGRGACLKELDSTRLGNIYSIVLLICSKLLALSIIHLLCVVCVYLYIFLLIFVLLLAACAHSYANAYRYTYVRI